MTSSRSASTIPIELVLLVLALPGVEACTRSRQGVDGAVVDAAADVLDVVDATLPRDAPSDSRDAADGSPRDVPVDTSMAPTVRLLSPLSAARVTGAAPVVAWEGGLDADHIEVQLCTERTCTDGPVTSSCAPTGSCALTAVRSPGVFFWRARPVNVAGIPGAWSATWEFASVARSAPRSSSVGLQLDVDADGRADVLYSGEEAPNERLYVRSGATVAAATSFLIGEGDDGGSLEVLAGTAGDVNGDGFSDLVVGVRSTFDGTWYHDHWALYPGGAAGLDPTASRSFEIAGFGQSPASRSVYAFGAGDLNRDGFGDIVVGTVGTESDPTAPGGCLFVYLGSATGPSVPTQQLCVMDGVSLGFGAEVASGGDVNGDGFADVVATSGSGNVEVRQFLGSATGLLTPTEIVIPGYGLETGGTAFLGDVNADGYADVGVAGGVPPLGDAALFVFLGGPTGIAAVPDGTSRVVDYGMHYLVGSVAPLGDIDGDGFDDVAIGNGGARNGSPPDASLTGMVAIFRGGPTGLAASPAVVILGPDGGNGRYGDQVSGPGDVDGDGHPDLVVGAADSLPTPADFGGRVYLYENPLAVPSLATEVWAGPPGERIGRWLARGR